MDILMDNVTNENITLQLTTTNNSNGNGGTYNYELEWTICEWLTLPFAIVSLYICVTQIWYFVTNIPTQKAKERRRNNGSALTQEKSQKKAVIVSNAMCAFAALCSFLRILDFRWIHGRFNDFSCDLTVRVKITTYVLALVVVYLILWSRQRVFYQHPGLQHLSSRLIRFLSWTLPILIVVAVGTNYILYAEITKYRGSPNGCIVTNNPTATGHWYVLLASAATVQVLLMALFIYPLIRHNMSVKSVLEVSRRKNHIIALVKRTTLTAGVCIFTDTIFAMVILAINDEVFTLTMFLYDVNIFINVICMLVSFADWRTRLTPWRAVGKVLPSNETVIPTVTRSSTLV